MEKVTGIGGMFFRASNPEELTKWDESTQVLVPFQQITINSPGCRRKVQRFLHPSTKLLTILVFGILMSLVAVIGGLFIFVAEEILGRWLKPIVAFAAGSLLGGAFFHMLPHALSASKEQIFVMLWVVLGFTAFFALDQLLEWHHCHRLPSEHVQPLGLLLMPRS